MSKWFYVLVSLILVNAVYSFSFWHSGDGMTGLSFWSAEPVRVSDSGELSGSSLTLKVVLDPDNHVLEPNENDNTETEPSGRHIP
ncbi:MAG TPA: CARDB domain-containing protein [Candidatus Nanoarchaeia archaeon]|nr:CARDB domain-containing protein [Candidatus Nanoarchaeia archaeon]